METGPPWPSFPRHPGGIWYFSQLPGTHPGSAPTLCRTHPLVQSVVAWPRHARPAGRHPPGPAPYLHGDHLHLHVGWEGQVGLEALGQGHEEMQGGQQVLAEDTWGGGGGTRSELQGYPNLGLRGGLLIVTTTLCSPRSSVSSHQGSRGLEIYVQNLKIVSLCSSHPFCKYIPRARAMCRWDFHTQMFTAALFK